MGTARAFATADRFFSEICAATNLFSNIFAIVVVARWMANSMTSAYASFSTATPNANVEPLDEPPLARKAQGHPAGYRGLACRVGGASR